MSEPILCSNTFVDSKERWRQIDHPTYGLIPFDVSTHGRIRNRNSGTMTRLYPNPKTRYLQFHWHRRCNGRRCFSSINVAPCVCRAFKRPRKEGETIEHMNQDRQDNRNSNLRYISLSRNIRRSFRLSDRKKGTGGRLTAEGYLLIRQLWKTGKWSQVKIGKACGLSNVHVCFIVNRTQEKTGNRELTVNWSVLAGTTDQAEIAKVIMEVYSI